MPDCGVIEGGAGQLYDGWYGDYFLCWTAGRLDGELG